MGCGETIQTRTTSLFLSRVDSRRPRYAKHTPSKLPSASTEEKKERTALFTPKSHIPIYHPALLLARLERPEPATLITPGATYMVRTCPFAGEIPALWLHTRLGTEYTQSVCLSSRSLSLSSLFYRGKDSSAIGKAKVRLFISTEI